MSEHSSSVAPSVKPERAEGSPLFWHASGRWAKKIRGKQEYFGRGSHDEALAEYNRRGPDLHTGRRPRAEEPTGHRTAPKWSRVTYPRGLTSVAHVKTRKNRRLKAGPLGLFLLLLT